jgi:pimeloyl-ACP methyl ester carboxylesterase/GNAT superfamily N-acetyltransferase
MTASTTEQTVATTRSGHVVVSGGRLSYEAAGSGSPLVLLHAGIADSGMWDDQWGGFAAHHQVIRYDLRGYGNSRCETAAFSHHGDLRDLLQALGIARAHILGASFGGRVALDFALAYPEMVDGLVLMGPGLGGYAMSSALDEVEVQIEAAFEASDFDRAAELDLRAWFDGPGRTPDQTDLAARVRAHAMARRVYATAASGPDPGRPERLEPPAIDRLERMLAPTLVIVGQGDQPDMLAIAELLEARLGEVTKVMLPDVAHLLNMERPQEFNALVLGFLERLDASRVELRELNADNWEQCVNLELADDQRYTLEPNAVSIAESRYHPWMLPLAIYHGEEMVGFTMFSTYPDPREGHHWVHRFMIDHRHQGRGFGRAGVREVLRYMAAIPGCDEIWIGYDERNDAAGRLYVSVGCVESGRAPWEGTDVAAVRRLGPAPIPLVEAARPAEAPLEGRQG